MPLYLLDTNVASNPPSDRDITDQLYGGDTDTRIRQEIVLGIGGLRVLKALGLEPTVYHMNEGHSALLACSLLEWRLDGRPASELEETDVEEVRHQCVFTTHTPVPARHDRFRQTTQPSRW